MKNIIRKEYDERGNLLWAENGNGYWEQREYDPITGELTLWEDQQGVIYSLSEARLNKGFKEMEPQIFKEFDQSGLKIEKVNEPNMGKNVFYITSDKPEYRNLRIKLLMYPSGKFVMLHYHRIYVISLCEKYNITTKDFEKLLGEWFISRHYNKLTLSEARLKLPIKQEKVKYVVKGWRTEEDRDMGESETMGVSNTIERAISVAKNYYNQQNFAAVEVVKMIGVHESDFVIYHLSSDGEEINTGDQELSEIGPATQMIKQMGPAEFDKKFKMNDIKKYI